MKQSIHQTRAAAVAGTFYPLDENTLKSDIQRYLKLAGENGTEIVTPKALVVPHAGYIFSGPIAASAYRHLIPLKQQIKRVVLLGPAHRTPFNGLALPEADTFSTPLGDIPIDHQGVQALANFDQVITSEQIHRNEHSLEVQLPFLQEVLDDFTLIPLVVGDANADEVAEVIKQLWGDEHTLIIISTDLSHYHKYNEAQQLDSSTSNAIINLKPELIDFEDACGRNGLKGLLTVATEKKLSVDLLDIRNSGDTAGDKERVVGYGAYAFH